MSGMALVASGDPRWLRPSVVRSMADALAFRGPDACHTWSGTGASVIHTLLSTVDDIRRDSQPLTIDGERWIVADARIDGRATLRARLGDAGEMVEADASD